MIETLDSIDRGLLQRIADSPGISMIDAGRPYLSKLTEGAIRFRVRNLSYKGYIRLEKVSQKVTRCFVVGSTNDNLAVIGEQAVSLAN